MGNEKSTFLALTFLLAMFLQVLFVFADTRDTPHGTAIAFSKAYFALDGSMARNLCRGGVTEDEMDAVSERIATASIQARQRGFDKGWMRSHLSHIQTRTTNIGENKVQVHLKAYRRKAINPLYAWIGSLFHLGESHPVEVTLDVVREDGGWKVCGQPFDLPAV